ncbi:MAG: hypothetical protein AAGC68_17080, partial [Verrucomicrobiota bacterium]
MNPPPFSSYFRSAASAGIAFAFLLFFPLTSRADRLIGVERDYGLVFEIDRMTGEKSSFVELPYQFDDPNSDDIRAFARHPATGIYYGLVYDGDWWPHLATIDPATGVIAPLVRIGAYENPGGSPSITFGPGPSYQLYLITGGPNYSVSPGTIYLVDLATGAATPTAWSLSGSGGHAIEYNPDDGFLYHFYKMSGAAGLERVNLSTGATTAVPLTGEALGQVNGVAYAGNGRFVLVNADTQTFFEATSGGFVSLKGSATFSLRTLAWDGSNTIGIGDDKIGKINLDTGAFTESVDLVSSSAYRDSWGIARNPVTGDIYLLTSPDSPEQNRPTLLVKFDPDSGTISDPVNLNVDNISEITFDNTGTLYGIAGAGFGLGSDLEGGTIVTIDLSTGTVTAESWSSSRNEFRDHVLAFNPDDGLLYHVFPNGSGSLVMETIDPANGGAVSSVSVVFPSDSSAKALCYDPSQGVFYFWQVDDLYRITTAGVATTVIENQTFDAEGLAIVPDRVIPPVQVDSNVLLAADLRKKLRKLRKRQKSARRAG